ncbi:TonB-dependent receptor plug domain-containing protein [Pseudomonas parakoreensis]
MLKDTGALNMQDALRTVPGITFGAGEGGNPQGDRPFIRGFDAQGDTYLDGVRDTGSQSREIFAVENIEVSKGPNSAIGGRGAAGGSINLVSKKHTWATRSTVVSPGVPTRPSDTPWMATTSSATPLPAA